MSPVARRPPGVTDFVHIGLVVEDLDEMVRFLSVIGLDAKQGLLDLRSEAARLKLVTRLFRAALRRLDFAERPAPPRPADQGRMSCSVTVKRSPDSSSSPWTCRRAGPVSVHSSRK